ncbi:hypothetical protein D3C86_2156220 [compost metagenome]
MFDMVKKFTAGTGAGHWIDIGKILVFARVEQLAHGPHVGNGHMAYFGSSNRLNELRRQ